MGDLERFLHERSSGLPALIKAGLAHLQFETIHPFLDGNGRLGRLLITLLLCAQGVLSEPLLYLSLYFKTHRQTYYSLLQRVRSNGDWESWLEFYLQGVRDTALQAAETALRILALFDSDRTRIERLGRAASSALRVHDCLKTEPLLAIPVAAQRLKLAQPTVTRAVSLLSELGVLEEVTGRARGRIFAYKAYLAILSEGTAPLPR